MNSSDVPPSTPVLVGVGQVAESPDAAGYRGLSAVELAAEAARRALADTRGDNHGVLTGLTAAIDTVAGVRQFENSIPGTKAPLGRSNNFPRSVAARLGATPRTAILEVSGGQGPQHLVTELAATIERGESEVALIVGAEALSTARHFAGSPDRPDFTEHIEGQLDDRGFGLDGVVSLEVVKHGLTSAVSHYALCEHARRSRLGLSRADYARTMGVLFAPFTMIAAGNPYAAAPTARDAAELTTVSERNRMIADPYPRYLCARELVNQSAAVVMMSSRAADRLGVPQDRRVYLHGHADVHERQLLDRPDLGSAPATALAMAEALTMAGVGVDELNTLDLYSCFPIAVSTVVDALGLRPDDPRGLTVTGGLPFFGGPGNNYSMHAIAQTALRARAQPGSYGLVGANGGLLSKYSVGVYSTTPAPLPPSRNTALQAEIAGWPVVPRSTQPEGWATVETYTVESFAATYTGTPGRARSHGVVVGRLESTRERFVASVDDSDSGLLGFLSESDPLGMRLYVHSFDFGNRVARTEEQMGELIAGRSDRRTG
ncbi:MAG TPA: acetyl-CoA acetyltransferase [Pseudonocardia sp.]|nr:acetyl-CoA acetyltransferase [Pseudonocardia sp.]